MGIVGVSPEDLVTFAPPLSCHVSLSVTMDAAHSLLGIAGRSVPNYPRSRRAEVTASKGHLSLDLVYAVMVFIPEDEFYKSITPTYYAGSDYLDFDRIEESLLEGFGLGSKGDQQSLLRLFDGLKGRQGDDFYSTLSSSLRQTEPRIATIALRVFAFLSSIPAAEEFLPLVLEDGQVHKFDLRPLKRKEQWLNPGEVDHYVTLLRALRVDRLVGDPEFNLRPVLIAVKVGSEGNLRKSRSGNLMVQRCDEVLTWFVREHRERWSDIAFTQEHEIGSISIADALGADKVDETLESIEDVSTRSITRREIQKKVDGLLTVSDRGRQLLVPCEFNAYFSSGGSKPSEIRRAYGYLSDHLPLGVALLWVTDGRLFLNRDMSKLDSLGRALVEFNRDRTLAMVITPALISKYLPRFIEENLDRL